MTPSCVCLIENTEISPAVRSTYSLLNRMTETLQIDIKGYRTQQAKKQSPSGRERSEESAVEEHKNVEKYVLPYFVLITTPQQITPHNKVLFFLAFFFFFCNARRG